MASSTSLHTDQSALAHGQSGITRSSDSMPPRDAERRLNTVLWIVQGLLTIVFLFAGGMKLVMPIRTLAAQSHMSGAFMKFIGVAEVAGALGLVLPSLIRARAGLTPLAAAGLVVIMIGATATTVAQMGAPMAALPFIVGLLCAFVAYGRWREMKRARGNAV